MCHNITAICLRIISVVSSPIIIRRRAKFMWAAVSSAVMPASARLATISALRSSSISGPRAEPAKVSCASRPLLLFTISKNCYHLPQ